MHQCGHEAALAQAQHAFVAGEEDKKENGSHGVKQYRNCVRLGLHMRTSVGTHWKVVNKESTEAAVWRIGSGADPRRPVDQVTGKRSWSRVVCVSGKAKRAFFLGY